MAKTPVMQKIRITKPCMVGGRPAKVGSEPTVPQDVANQLIGTLCAKPVANADEVPADVSAQSKSTPGAK